MTRVLKIEAFSGASGDMFLGALAGLTNSYEELVKLPELLNLQKDAEVIISEVNRNGIVCKHVKVVELVPQHHHRHLKNILELIDSSKLTDNAKNIAIDIFNIIGLAESNVHGIPLEKIHFHEVGAVDSIIDICGTAYLLDKLKIKETYLTELVTGKGFVKTAHGMLPVPCPATKLIIEGLPYKFGDEEGEKLTPTGAAIIKYLNPKTELPSMLDLSTSYGTGEKDFNIPNVLRLSVSELLDSPKNEIIVIEANIDDGNNEYLGIEFQDKLLESGALDFYFAQIIMKKGRPGLLLNVICKKRKFKDVTDYILNFSSTIGLRYYSSGKISLDRKAEEIETEYGKFRIKVSRKPDGTNKIKPESEDVLRISFEKQINPNTLSQLVIGQYEKDN